MPRTRRVLGFAIVAALSLLALAGPPSVARAQEPPPSAAVLERAKLRYREGVARYTRGDFNGAIAEFKASYDLSHRADILFNIAQAYDKLGKRKKTIGYLKRYIQGKPDAADRSDVEARIATLEGELEAEHAAARDTTEQAPPADRGDDDAEGAPAGRGATTERGDEPDASPGPEASLRTAGTGLEAEPDGKPRPGRGLRVAGYAGIGAAVVAAGVGVFFGLKARSDASELEEHLEGNGQVFDQEAQELEDRGQRHEKLSFVLYAAGGVALATGVVLAVVGHKRGARGESAAVAHPRRLARIAAIAGPGALGARFALEF